MQWNVAIRLVLAAALWAACFPLITLALPSSPHLTLAALRAVLAASVLLAVAFALKRHPARRATWGWLALAGLGTTTLGFLGMVHASEFVSPGIATVVANTQPLAAALIAWLFLRERIRRVAWVGLLLGFAGVALIAGPSLLGGTPGNYGAGMGNLALVAVGNAVGNVVMKHLAGKVDALMAMGVQLLIGAVPLAIAAIVLEKPSEIQWSATFTAALLALSVAGTALPYWLWFSVLDRVSLSQANAWTFLVVPLGLAAGLIFFGEELTLQTVAGTGLVLLGIWMTQTASTNVESSATKSARENT